MIKRAAHRLEKLMDQTLVDLFLSAEKSDGPEHNVSEVAFRYINEDPGEVEIDCADGPKRYVLKPLGDLFGNGLNVSSIDWQDQHFMPLLVRIEQEIMRHDDFTPDLTDGLVGLTLDRMTANPATAPGNDVLCRRIQLGLRILLSMRNFSKQEVKLAIRKIAKSVELHSSREGVRGYLDFIRRQFQR